MSTVIDGGDNVEEMSDCPKAFEAVEVEYVPDQAELNGIMGEVFRKVFEKFNFIKPVALEEDVKNDEAYVDKIGKKNVESDDEELEQDRKREGCWSFEQTEKPSA